MYDLDTLKKDAEKIRKSGYFDSEWYRATYPDLDRLGMEPAEHYLRYGTLMRRDPGPEFSTGFYLDTHPGGWQKTTNPLTRFHGKGGGKMTPDRRSILLAAHNLARTGQHDRAIALAEAHLPEDLAYTAHILRANADLAHGRKDGWLSNLNAYLAQFDVAPVVLEGEGALLDRFATAPLPPVTGGPLVSVIMPAWNAEATVRAAARSILKQTWKNLELLIVDDASEDGTWVVLQEIAAGDDRVKIRRNRVNVGPYVSKNLALMEAKGEWITGHDADDWAHPERLEKHLTKVLASHGAIKASTTKMLRVEPDGSFDRLSMITGFCFDGAAREASISFLVQSDLLREKIGAWDCVKFGADSEIIERAKTILGDHFVDIKQISMLCMNYEGSLTNNSVFGVDKRKGPSEIRINYSKGWRDWHKSIKDGKVKETSLKFPPEYKREFPSPDEMLVNHQRIMRNYLSFSNDTSWQEPVTAICVSRRPEFLDRVIKMLAAHTYSRLQVVYVAHGAHHDMDLARQKLARLDNVQIFNVVEDGMTLGDCLNLGLDNCRTDLVAKIDDDDYYGPDYIKGLVLALKYSGQEDVVLTGKNRAFVYVESRDILGKRYKPNTENAVRERVHGGTILWSRKAVGDQRFKRSNTGEDSDFFRQIVERGQKIFSADRYDYIHVRYARSGAHTWTIEDDEFLKPVEVVARGLQLHAAYSIQLPKYNWFVLLPDAPEF